MMRLGRLAHASTLSGCNLMKRNDKPRVPLVPRLYMRAYARKNARSCGVCVLPEKKFPRARGKKPEAPEAPEASRNKTVG